MNWSIAYTKPRVPVVKTSTGTIEMGSPSLSDRFKSNRVGTVLEWTASSTTPVPEPTLRRKSTKEKDTGGLRIILVLKN